MPITEAESELVRLGRRYRLAWQQITTMRRGRLTGMRRRVMFETHVGAGKLVIRELRPSPQRVIRSRSWDCHWA